MPKVTVNISSSCSSPYVHQPTLLQLSIGDKWVPPAPLSFPNTDVPSEDDAPAKSPKLSVEKIAGAARIAVEATAGISGLTSVSSAKSPKGSARVFSFSFDVEGVDEVDMGLAGKNATPQLKVSIDVDNDTDKEFKVKVLPRAAVIRADRAGGWPESPEKTRHNTVRMRKGSKRTIRVKNDQGIADECRLPPAMGGNQEFDSDALLGATEFGVSLVGGWSKAATYVADDFYYPRPRSAGMTDEDLAITGMLGYSPGSRAGRAAPGASSLMLMDAGIRQAVTPDSREGSSIRHSSRCAVSGYDAHPSRLGLQSESATSLIVPHMPPPDEPELGSTEA